METRFIQTEGKWQGARLKTRTLEIIRNVLNEDKEYFSKMVST